MIYAIVPGRHNVEWPLLVHPGQVIRANCADEVRFVERPLPVNYPLGWDERDAKV